MAPGKIPGSSGTRNLADNLSDLKAQIAANHKVKYWLTLRKNFSSYWQNRLFTLLFLIQNENMFILQKIPQVRIVEGDNTAQCWPNLGSRGSAIVIGPMSLFASVKCWVDDGGVFRLFTTPRCAEFSRWLQCHTIYRKKIKKDQKLHILPFLGSLFWMAQSEFSKNDAKPFIFPKIPKKTLFLGYDFFFNLNFHYVPDT